MFQKVGVAILFFALVFSSCSIENQDLASNIRGQKIIKLYNVCPHKNGETIKEDYLFKIKNDRVTLLEKVGDRVNNKSTTDLSIVEDLEDFILVSAEESDQVDVCRYYIKCGLQESLIYPSSEDMEQFNEILAAFESN